MQEHTRQPFALSLSLENTKPLEPEGVGLARHLLTHLAVEGGVEQPTAWVCVTVVLLVVVVVLVVVLVVVFVVAVLAVLVVVLVAETVGVLAVAVVLLVVV